MRKPRKYVRQEDLDRLDVLDVGVPRRKKNGLLIFYKFVYRKDRRPPIQRESSIRYTDGVTLQVGPCDRNPGEDCGRGLNILSHKPTYSEAGEGMVLLRVLVDENDIACVPYASSFAGVSKIRVRKLIVDREVRWADPS